MLMDTITFVFTVITFVISISLHEYAHALVSYKLGDPTPKIQGRVTPNPVSHVDPLGLLCVFVLRFGWGKPVVINPSYYKNPVRDELFVALAGPATNIALAIIAIIVLLAYSVVSGYPSVVLGYDLFSDPVLFFWRYFSIVNVALAVFNMIPLPPLDGFRIIKMFFPGLAFYLLRYSREIAIGFLGLFVFLPLLGISYFSDGLSGFIITFSTGFFDIFYGLLSLLFY